MDTSWISVRNFSVTLQTSGNSNHKLNVNWNWSVRISRVLLRLWEYLGVYISSMKGVANEYGPLLELIQHLQTQTCCNSTMPLLYPIIEWRLTESMQLWNSLKTIPRLSQLKYFEWFIWPDLFLRICCIPSMKSKKKTVSQKCHISLVLYPLRKHL